MTRSFFEKLNQSPKFRIVVEDFVKKAIGFTSETGAILDIAGDKNIVFGEVNEEWRYELPDALSMHTEPVAERAGEAIHALTQEQTLEGQEWLFLLKGTHYTRIINALAIQIGIPDRLKIVAPEDRDVDVDIFNAIIAGSR
jgi:hypothetical protein